jgi:hypothetical protein
MIKQLVLGFIWGVLSAMMGYSVLTAKGFVVFTLGYIMIVIVTWNDVK